MAQPSKKIRVPGTPIEGPGSIDIDGPIDFPTPGDGSTFFADMKNAVESYPARFVDLEIVEVDFPGTVLNAAEEGSYKVQVTNRGALNLTDVTLKVQGLNGATVKTGGAADFDYRDELTIGMEEETITGHGGSALTQGSKLKFKAPGGAQDSALLIKATLEEWNANLDHILNAHSDPTDPPAGTYSDEVVGN